MKKIYEDIQKHLTPEFLRFANYSIENYKLSSSGAHSLHHWLRVAENAFIVANSNGVQGVDRKVILYFAFSHDMMRETEHHCEVHGKNAAKKLRIMRENLLTELDDKQFKLLLRACAGHTVGLHDSNPTIGACWDGDRLDLFRVGIYPDGKYLNHEASKCPMLIQERSNIAAMWEINSFWYDYFDIVGIMNDG